MRRFSVLLAVVVLAASLSGCAFLDKLLNKAPAATTTVTPPSTVTAVTPGGTQTIANALVAAKFTFSTNDSAAALKGMKTAAALGKLTKFVINGTKNTVDVTVGELTDVTQAAAVKAEIQEQMAMLAQFAPDTVVDFVDAKNTSLIVTVTYNKADAALGGQVKAALVK